MAKPLEIQKITWELEQEWFVNIAQDLTLSQTKNFRLFKT